MKIDDVARIFVLDRATPSAICVCTCVYAHVYTCDYVYAISYARQFFQDQDKGDGMQDRVLLMAVARRLPVVLSSRTKIFTWGIACDVRVISTSKRRAELGDRLGASNLRVVGAALSRLRDFPEFR